jgi:hypothetical protein
MYSSGVSVRHPEGAEDPANGHGCPAQYGLIPTTIKHGHRPGPGRVPAAASDECRGPFLRQTKLTYIYRRLPGKQK